MVQRRKHSRRGFNLIEAAIVLGVVGVVIGGIWVAASAVSQKHRVQQTMDGFLFLAEKLNEIYGKGPVTSNCDGTWDNCHLELTAQQLQALIGLPPAGWRFNADGTLDSPIFSEIGVDIVGHQDVVYPEDHHAIWIWNNGSASNVSDCISFGVLALKSLNAGKLTFATVGGNTKYAYGLLKHGAYEWETDTGSGSGLIDPLLATHIDDCYSVQIDISRP